MLTRRRELVDSDTQMMVADDFYDGKLWMDLHQQEQTKWLQRFAGVDVQQTRDVEFCPQIFRALTMDGSAGRQQGVHSKVCSSKIPR